MNQEEQIRTKGYYFDTRRKKYVIKCTISGKRRTIGYCETVWEAEAIYKEAKLKELAAKERIKNEILMEEFSQKVTGQKDEKLLAKFLVIVRNKKNGKLFQNAMKLAEEMEDEKA